MKCRYKLSHLDCANCARKIENYLIKDENINKVSVNFAKLEMVIDTNVEKGTKEYVANLVKKIEPDTKVLDLDEKQQNKIIYDVIRLSIGILCFIISLFVKHNIIHEIFIILAYAFLLFRVVKKAIWLLFTSFTLDENLLVSISCIGAYLTNNVHEGLMVIILYEIGKILESIAVNNSRKSISELMNIKPEYANLKVKDTIKKVDPSSVKLDDVIVVKKGEKVPLDGVIISGDGKLDKSALTGESNLVTVSEGDEILSGSINTEGILTIKVTKLYENSTVANILALVENATDKKAKTENFVSKAAKIYTPVILLLAILIALVLPLFGISFTDAIYRALVFLVVSCPCAIAISVPLSYFSGIGASSKNGILIKGSNYLEVAHQIKEIIFDKTGTLTTGDAINYNLEILDDAYTEKEVIKYYVSGEILSNHPIAKAILNIFGTDDVFKVKDFEEVTGKGIKYKYRDEEIKIGSFKYCGVKDENEGIFLKIGSKVVAKLVILDGIKANAKETISQLKAWGIDVKMFTGDNKDIALNIGEKVGIKNVEYELLPQDKFTLLENDLDKYAKKVAFVGDGINDAPVLKMATLGISMGNIGSEAAIEASDIVIMNDRLESIITLINISKKTARIIKQNLIFAIGIKLLVLILSALGMASMWQAVFADTGVTLLTIINTTRILKK